MVQRVAIGTESQEVRKFITATFAYILDMVIFKNIRRKDSVTTWIGAFISSLHQHGIFDRRRDWLTLDWLPA